MTSHRIFRFGSDNKLANQYIRLSKAKTDLLILNKLSDVLEDFKPPSDPEMIENYKWTRFCIWQSIYINYHKLYSEPMKIKGSNSNLKFTINAKDVLKDAPKELLNFHDKIHSVRHHFFVHGGTNIFEQFELIADAYIEESKISTQLRVEGIRSPTIDDLDIIVLRELITFLLDKIESKMEKCSNQIVDVLHETLKSGK